MNAVNPEGVLVGFEQMDHVAGTADSRHDDRPLRGLLGLDQPVPKAELQRAPDAEVPAAGAPLEVVFGVSFAHAATPSFLPDSRRALILAARF